MTRAIVTGAVVAGTDGSAESLAAADWAADDAVRRGLPLRLVQAVPPGHGRTGPVTSAGPRERVTRPAWSAHPTADEIGRRHPDLSVTVDQIAEQVLPVLFSAADSAELMVLGTRGAGAVQELVLGSTALTVAGRAPVPVVLVSAASGTGAPPGADGAGDVVLGLDLAAPDGRPVEFAFDEAARRGARLRVVHGWSEPLHDGAGPDDPDQALAAALGPWAEKHPRTPVVTEAVIAGAAARLAAAASHAALLVLGRRPRTTPVSAHLGSTAHAVLRRVTLPVAIVPHAPAGT
ncbi:universal stress protein [Streptomyces sp. NPDC088910]|uniref:universal stress protein n=1 Tax=Streptomyces sp. NPDC088910 TaxID=3365911 RepID=UPI003807871E